jgi:hypothetical protein
MKKSRYMEEQILGILKQHGGVGEAWRDVGEVVAHPNLEPSAAFNHREDRRHARSSLFATDVNPVFSARSSRSILSSVRFASVGEMIPP